MTDLSLDLFAAAADAEAARYRVLAALQRARRAFARNCVAPDLARLVGLHRDLRALLDGAGRVEGSGSGRAVGVDWETGRVVHAAPPAPLALSLARWAQPHVAGAVREGQALYEFAAEHAALDAVGVVPAYRDEGYLVVAAGGAVRPLRYHVSSLAGADGRYRALRTSDVDVALDPLAPPAVWKAALAASDPDLPAPALFSLRADLDLPVDETLLPVAKRKLLGLVQSWGVA